MSNQSTYSTISISPEILKKTRDIVTELNVVYKISQKSSLLTTPITFRKRKKTLHKVEDLTIKTFTEAALLHFITAKIDPRFYEDNSIGSEINRLRNHLLGFIITQENKFILPFQKDIQGLKHEMMALKKGMMEETDTVESTALETQATLMGLVFVLFDMLDIDQKERTRLEELLQKKGLEFIEKIQN